ncbi:cytochrome P450 [Mycena galopus ATCC 62051]|nr:cytochrome P450 [Mycena galopus ATCC 62051]
MSVILYCFLLSAGALVVLAFWRQGRRASILPPGPPGDPLIGHLLRMPSTDSALVFHEWSKTYGPVMHLKVLGRSMIILDSYEAAVDLLDKRGVIYSDRPKFTLYELLGWHPTLTFLQYGKKFNIHRQMHQSYLSRHKIEGFKLMQTQEARTLVKNLFESTPDEYEKFVSRFATGVITQIVAGHQITSDDDPYLHMSRMVFEAMAKTGPPGSSPLDFFPLLQYFPPWFPGAAHVGVVRTWNPTMRELHEFPLRTVKHQRARTLSFHREAGEAMPSFILEQLEDMEEGADEEDLKGAAATMFGAGEVTTWGTLSTFILAMVLHPECQTKAQKQIDSVVGGARLPEFGDREDLPFVDGILQETLRCVPHRVMEDDVYQGMLIPRGSLVFSNVRGMSLDENMYSNPTSFNPQRYLPTPVGRSEPNFSNIICTGEFVADKSLWIAIASILATCKITNAVDENGKIIVPESTLTDGLIRQPSKGRPMYYLSAVSQCQSAHHGNS